MASKAIRRYLDRHAESIVSIIQDDWLATLRQTYQFVLVIPLFNEALNCLDSVLPKTISNTLIIAVVNASVDADLAAIHQTQAFLEQFHPQPDVPFIVMDQPLGNTLLLIDCCTATRQLPHKQGVGLARKIGGDVALACIAAQKVEIPWIHCTDGDVQLPADYFDTPNLGSDVAVAIYPFRHWPLNDNILRYDISLRYYVVALAQAASPYAFQAIGSLLRINANHYAQVRGFPKRQAAEDFYMLNKLAKTGKVVRLKQPEVLLSSRISRRVPFGTGAAMARLSEDPEMLLYHPQIFSELRSWQDLDQLLWQELQGLKQFQADPASYLRSFWQHHHLSESLLQTLMALKLDQALGQALRQNQDFPHFQFFLRVWFDAFRTLKFVHHQRQHYWPSLSIQAATALYWDDHAPNPSSTDEVNPLQQDHLDPSLLQIWQQLTAAEHQLPSETGPTLPSLGLSSLGQAFPSIRNH